MEIIEKMCKKRRDVCRLQIQTKQLNCNLEMQNMQMVESIAILFAG